VELRSVHLYWHIPDDSPVYPSSLWSNRMVGILWSNLAQYSTWFGGIQSILPCNIWLYKHTGVSSIASAYEVHGIQQLPYTPISEVLLLSSFVTLQWPVFERACDIAHEACRAQGWLPFTICNQAIINRDDAWTRALLLTDDVCTLITQHDHIMRVHILMSNRLLR
jgi:endo-1,3(4)-beta-glucanase